MKIFKKIISLSLILTCLELVGCTVYTADPAGYPYGLVYPPQVDCGYYYPCACQPNCCPPPPSCYSGRPSCCN